MKSAVTAGTVLLLGIASLAPADPVPTTTTTPAATPSDTPSPPPSLSRVPAVEGLSLARAMRKLRAAGLNVGDLNRRPSSKTKDTVLEQRIDKGTKLELGSSVPLVVAAPLPEVASVVGEQGSSAIRKLKKAGFKVEKTTQTRTTGKDGVILSQSPAGGTRAKPRSVVRVVISNVQRSPDTGRSSNCTPGYSPFLPLAFDYDCRGGSGNAPNTPDQSESLAPIPMG